MKKILILTMMALFCSTISFAGPIKSIDLDYDLKEQKLNVKVHHISRERDEEYIRKIKVYRNGEEVEKKLYNFQKNPTFFEDEIEVEAEKKDELKVKVYVSEGGVKTAEIVVDKKSDEVE